MLASFYIYIYIYFLSDTSLVTYINNNDFLDKDCESNARKLETLIKHGIHNRGASG